MSDSRPLLALTLGDPSGIGPEIVHAALRAERVRSAARLVVLGPGSLRGESAPLVACPEDVDGSGGEAGWIDTGAEGEWILGRPQVSGGAAALAALKTGAELASYGLVDGLVTAPVSKEALHLVGAKVEGQTQLLAHWAGKSDVQMLAVARRLRVMLCTRHLPLREALAALTSELVHKHLVLLRDGLRTLGFAQPRIALAGLNPHAGEAGLLGSEEGDLLEPALERARADGLDVHGPVSPDVVFLQAAQGRYDGVLALYHDQAFIPVKLHAPNEGVTVLVGLPYLRVSPAHGTAFDIVGQGVADPTNLIVAIEHAAAWARR